MIRELSKLFRKQKLYIMKKKIAILEKYLLTNKFNSNCVLPI